MNTAATSVPLKLKDFISIQTNRREKDVQASSDDDEDSSLLDLPVENNNDVVEELRQTTNTNFQLVDQDDDLNN